MCAILRQERFLATPKKNASAPRTRKKRLAGSQALGKHLGMAEREIGSQPAGNPAPTRRGEVWLARPGISNMPGELQTAAQALGL